MIDYIEDIEDDNTQINVDKGELAVGLKVPTSVKLPVSYLDTLRKYTDIYNDIYKQMEVCNKLYKYNGIIGNAVDVLVDFAVSNVDSLPTGNKKLDKLLNHWFEILNQDNSNSLPGVRPLTEEVCLEWFTSGNVFPYKKWDNVEFEGRTYKLPMAINLINPQSIQLPEGPIAFGQEVIYLKYDDKLISKLSADGRTDPEAALIKAAVPRSVLSSILNQKFQNSYGVRLNPKFITHLKRRAKGYQAWGVPYLTRCFSSAALLERLRELDESVATGIMNLITVFKIGTDEHPASPARLAKFASLLRNPKATTTLVWAHDIDLIQAGPDGKVLQFKNKFEDAKQDVLIALGIPPVLMSLSQSGNAWVSILSLVERLSHWRKQTGLWLEGICAEIAEENGFEGIKPKIKWDRMNLTDEQAIKNLVLSFHDRGLISISTTLREAGYHFESELEAKKEEKAKGIAEEFMPPQLPFTGSKDQGRPSDSSPQMTNKIKKADKTSNESDVNLQTQKRKNKKEPIKKEIEE